MKKKYIITGITCGMLILSGICYSCAYRGSQSDTMLNQSLTQEESTGEESSGSLNSKDSAVIEDSSEENDSDGTVLEGSQAEEVSGQDVLISEAAKIYVHICGAVTSPGVYLAAAGARVCDLIEMSGGLLKDAAGDYINQAETVTDGERIYIPTKDEVEGLAANEVITGNQNVSVDNGETSALININTANAEELMSLPGIGQAKADSIIEYRNANGNFQSAEELMNISGIKEGLFNRISSYITVK